MREAQIYIKNIKKQNKLYSVGWGGGYRLSTVVYFYSDVEISLPCRLMSGNQK